LGKLNVQSLKKKHAAESDKAIIVVDVHFHTEEPIRSAACGAPAVQDDPIPIVGIAIIIAYDKNGVTPPLIRIRRPNVSMAIVGIRIPQSGLRLGVPEIVEGIPILLVGHPKCHPDSLVLIRQNVLHVVDRGCLTYALCWDDLV
jgi:hypothetical protein